MFQNINQGLVNQRTQILNNESQPTIKINPNKGTANISPSIGGPFRSTTIVFNAKGTIINKPMLGNHFYSLIKNIQLDKTQTDRVYDMTIGSQNFTSHFRTLLVKVPKSNSNPLYAGNYAMIVENIDADLLALKSFERAILITIIFFWILAISIAYFLSKSSMKPILSSWKKQREFSANAAHELRTPLTVIQNQLEFMLTKPNDKILDQAEKISTSLNSVNQLQNLTGHLLTLSRADADVSQVSIQSQPLKPFFTEVISPYQDVADSQSKSLTVTIDTPGAGAFDSGLIRQLLVILIDNGLKYSPTGGNVGVAITRIKDTLNIKVSDNGPGIPDTDKKRIFDRFYRTDKSRNSKTGGNGLGLAIASTIVSQHHGKISVHDNQPVGSIFEVNIPLKSHSNHLSKK
ncbi:sensor histidine kinase [Lentilactobacillus kosonis]|uniref:histidine kinase n=1 Tax=Lentilactobacillus kosonis TaxID=2810561 RepID=A0A401FIV6_9LACO|nr:HAMP domain-containing sensor histidine kinase [Lentilactobacillus kosonis]GAY72181.1 osmosensitive K+ channel histidine kinase KdpD [Lentilactobacillus kosonis]